MKKQSFESHIVYEDEHYIVVNKPALIATLQDRVQPYRNMLVWARQYCSTAQACHRLDKETSGILVFAKDPLAYRSLAKQFEKRTVEKIYHAMVEGVHNFSNTVVSLPIYSNTRNRAKVDKVRGKEAETLFNTLEIFRGYTLISCKPVTGKTHQIRVHSAHLKAPLVGDIEYRGQPLYLSKLKRRFHLKNNTEELPLIQRTALHAYGIQFVGLEGTLISIQAPYPKDFQALLAQLGRYAPAIKNNVRYS